MLDHRRDLRGGQVNRLQHEAAAGYVPALHPLSELLEQNAFMKRVLVDHHHAVGRLGDQVTVLVDAGSPSTAKWNPPTATGRAAASAGSMVSTDGVSFVGGGAGRREFVEHRRLVECRRLGEPLRPVVRRRAPRIAGSRERLEARRLARVEPGGNLLASVSRRSARCEVCSGTKPGALPRVWGRRNGFARRERVSGLEPGVQVAAEKRLADGRKELAVNAVRVAKANLHLGRVDVDIHLLGRDLQVEERHEGRVRPSQEPSVRLRQGVGERTVSDASGGRELSLRTRPALGRVCHVPPEVNRLRPGSPTHSNASAGCRRRPRRARESPSRVANRGRVCPLSGT